MNERLEPLEFVARPGALFEARVDDLTQEGLGVARIGRLVVFVAGTVPGDLVRARLTRIRKGWAEAERVALVVPSPERREPPCPHQSLCGGCPLMVLPADVALQHKARHLEQVLRRIGRIEHAVDACVASPVEFGYRGRVRFAVAPRADAPAFGYRPRGEADTLVPIGTCHLAPPRASELARCFLTELAAITPSHDRPWPAQLSVRGSLASGEWLLVLHGPGGPWPECGRVSRALVEREPDLAGVVRVVPGAGARELLQAGRDSVVERIGAATVELGATTFLQVNPGAAELLYREVRVALTGAERPRRVLDLYCGVGLVGLLAVDPGTALVGVELHPGSVERARRAADRAGRTNLEYRAADALTAARDLARAGERFDRVVLNPPRAGAGAEAAARVRALGAEVVVVVSCHPAALARDLAAFGAAGYTLDRLAAVDLFPQTPHLEAVARLVAT